MHTKPRRVLIGSATFLFLLAAAISGGVYYLSRHDWRGLISARASATLGRRLTIGGPVHLALSLHPVVTADDVTIANAPWGSRPQMAAIRHLEVRLALIPLLSGETRIDDLQLVGLNALIEKNADGSGNWQSAHDAAALSGQRQRFPILAHLAIRDSVVRYLDPSRKTDMTFGIGEMDGQGGEGSAPATIAGQGSYQRRSFALRAKLGSISLLRTADQPYPLDLDLRMGETHLQVHGDLTEPVKLGAMQVALMLEGPNMEELWTLLGWPLAPTPRYRLSGELTKKETTWRINGLDARIGHTRLAGTVSVRVADNGPPVVDGDLRSSLLDVADVKGFLGQAKPRPKHAAATDGLLSNHPFNLSKLRSVNGELRFRAERISARNLLLDDVAFRLRMKDGKLELDPLELGVASGKIASNLTLDARRKETTASGKLSIRRLDFHRVLRELAITSHAMGRLGGEAVIRTHGTSLHRMAAHLNGHLSLVMEGGLLDRLLLELIALHLGDLTDSWLHKGQALQVNCIVARFAVRDGLMNAETFLVDTPDSNILGQGTIDLARERIDMTLTAHSKEIKLGLTAPIHVTGDLRLRRAAKTSAGAIARGGLALALGAAVNPLAAVIPLLDIPNAEPNACQKAFSGARTTSGKLQGEGPPSEPAGAPGTGRD